MRTVHPLTQGSPEWSAHRARIFNASEACAAMGASKYTTRSQLLAQKSTGIAPQVDSAKQALFDKGHAVEAPTIALIEELAGDELAPVVASIEIDGLTLGASYDGLTMMEDTAGEVKLWNEELAAQIRRGELEPHYYWQLEQEFIVTPTLQRIIFATSDGTRERFVHMEYRPVPGRREQLIATWKQFAADLNGYVTPERAALVVAEPVQALPAVTVAVDGAITIKDNFPAFETALRDFLDHRLIREPQSDQDFADLDLQIKAMKGAEAMLESAEANWSAQIEAVGNAKRRKDMLHKLVRDNRLMAEKLLASEKERRKGEIVAGGVAALRKHIDDLNTRIGQPMMPVIPADFAGAIRGKSSLAKMEDAVDAALANAKIAANETADRITVNLRTMRAHGDYDFLFADIRQHIAKPTDDFQAMVQSRVLAHQAEEKRRAEAAAEKERERIRAEEQAKAEREARERIAAEQRAQVPVATQAPAAAPAAPPAVSSKAPAANSPSVVPIARGKPTLRIGDIQERLGGIPITAHFVETTLGIKAAKRENKVVWFLDTDWDRICQALMFHVDRARTSVQLEAA